jgi:hypothetical protein
MNDRGDLGNKGDQSYTRDRDDLGNLATVATKAAVVLERPWRLVQSW